ncbi:MAG: acyl carrier protein [Alphaproteobacteria bacterium]|nr:acyl carrier protein [Alphaproteobacteria bacterium]
MADTIDAIAEIIASTCNVDRATITPESHIIDDLGVDSLDFLDIAFAIDKRFGIKMPVEGWMEDVNAGRASSDDFFILRNLATRIDALAAARPASA